MKILNAQLNEIFQDTRSLTRITNIILEQNFKSKELCFEIYASENGDYIKVYHKKKLSNKYHFRFDWAIFLTESGFTGLHIQYLVGVNYSFLKNKKQVGEFVKSKKWVDDSVLRSRLITTKIRIGQLHKEKEQLETFCS